MAGTNEAFARVRIDDLLRDAGWKPDDPRSVRLEQKLKGGLRADYVLADRHGRPMAAIEAKRAATDPVAAQDQGIEYARLLGVPFVFLSNGEEQQEFTALIGHAYRTMDKSRTATTAVTTLSASLMDRLLDW